MEAARPRCREEEARPQEPDDPYAQPSFNPWRGVRKAAWRMWVFYGVFSVAVVAGVVLLLRHASGPEARFIAVWASTYVILNLASGGLPGPNLVRYNKDHEIVAPALLHGAGRGRRLALAACPLARPGLRDLATSRFALTRAVHYLTEKFVLER